MKTYLIRTSLSFILAGTASLIPTFALAQNHWLKTVIQQLYDAAINLGLKGYTLTHEPSLDVIGEGTHDELTLNLGTGISYSLIGVCKI